MSELKLKIVANERSKFTVKDLNDLNDPARAYKSPLAVIAHIDVNAFFAQVEQLRLGLSVNDPVVCLQWSTLIAVSYAARDFGVNRMDSIETAKLKCPNLKAVHTAVFKKGENYWKYHDNTAEFPKPKDYKVSLDPYRRESRKIMKIFKSNCDLVEKASVDESFMDLGRIVLYRLFELFPNFAAFIEEHSNDDLLPNINKFDMSSLPIIGDFILSEEEKENNELIINDWDDILVLIGAKISSDIRAIIEKQLGYTTSCGIGRVKTIAKLASGFRKPNNQTIVRTSAIERFMKNFKFTDFWSMGGKTGEFIKERLSLETDEDSINIIRNSFELNELEEMLEDKQIAIKLYQLVRGEFKSPLSEKISLKSMNSNKNLRGDSGKTFKDACDWMKVFSADLFQRIVELQEETFGISNSNVLKLRPKTISIMFRSAKDFKNAHSKQCSLPVLNKDEIEETFFKSGVKLLKELEQQFGNIYPLVNLNMTITNFDDDDSGTNSILNFTKKGDISDVFDKFKTQEQVSKAAQPTRVIKHLKPETGKDIKDITSLFSKELRGKSSTVNNDPSAEGLKEKEPETINIEETGSEDGNKSALEATENENYTTTEDGYFLCKKCNSQVLEPKEHDDLHFAIELSKDINGEDSLSEEQSAINNRTKSYAESLLESRIRQRARSSKPITKKAKFDKNQSKLPFN